MSTNPDDIVGPSGEPQVEGQAAERQPVTTEVDTPVGTVSITIDASAVQSAEPRPPALPETTATDADANAEVAAAASRTTSPAAAASSSRKLGAAPTDGGSFFGALSGVPIEYLIATPLLASARANMALAQVMTEFIDELAYEQDGKTTRLVSFQLTRETQDPVTKAFKPQTVKVEAPLLALVPIPALLVQSVTIDLTVEISQSLSQNSSSTTNASLNVGANWGWGNASFTGSYTNTQSSTRASNQSAKYEVTVNAQQQAVPEGMSRLMDVFASTITPLTASAS